MKLDKILNIEGAVLNKHQLEQYFEKVASDHVIKNSSDKNTFPIKRLNENFEAITVIYNLLNRHIKIGINIHPAGEWILDNYYIIEESVKLIKKELKLKKYISLPGIANGKYKGFARIYVVATQIVAYTDNKIDDDILMNLLRSYQNKKTLSMEEIWSIPIFIQLALIENITEICEKIYSSQMQKYKVENIVERLVEKKSKEDRIFEMKNPSSRKVETARLMGYSEMKYPFIEYMSYRLKKYGRKASLYLEALEEQVSKMGTNVSDVIRKEHFDIAVKKVSIGNAIRSLKEVMRINLVEIFNQINGVEEILSQDPINVYEKMTYETKTYYQNEIKRISNKTKISEIYIAKKALELAQENVDNKNAKEAHIGYYLISDGKQKLLSNLQCKKVKYISKENKVKLYIGIIYIVSLIIDLMLSINIYNETKKLLITIGAILLIYIPITEIVIQIIQYISSKITRKKIIPKLDFLEGVPESSTTFVVIPTIISTKEKVKDLIKRLEVFYLANKSENIYFALLGDCTSSSRVEEKFDNDIIKYANRLLEQLNKKYNTQKFPKFHFLYRNRKWNDKEKCYLGWERKRGLLNQFNEYILGNQKNEFRENSIEKWKNSNEDNKIPEIKYVITLDADTNLVLNSGLELIGAMSHILNTPILNEKKDVVLEGHGIMQPRVGIDLTASRKSIFTKIFAGAGGTDSYTNAISDIYQDNFEEGIFTGKGIYDLKIFSQVLNRAIPDNTVLSHDLLEGNFLRCGLVSDILLLDGYPYKYNSYMARQHRWIRGDWQIVRWLKNDLKDRYGNEIKNPLNLLSKYKIFDNLRRSVLEINIIISIFIFLLIKIYAKIKIWTIILTLIIAATIPSVIEILNSIVYRKQWQNSQKNFSNNISGFKQSIIRLFLYIGWLPDKAYVALNAISKTIYRMVITKQNLLEWTTSEEAEKKAKTDINSYYKIMWSNLILGIIILFSDVNIFFSLLGLLWIITPYISCKISKEIMYKNKLEELNKEDKNYLINLGEKTWKFFSTYINEENNYLPPDNYQEDRAKKIVDRTSSTNIGLGLLAVISAYDLKYINFEKTIYILEKMIETIERLPKWNGHLYNWYNIKTLEPLNPRYISTVDSGNYVGYLFTVKQFFIQKIENRKINEDEKNKEPITEKLESLIQILNNQINSTDFSCLYNQKSRLFSIGFNVEENKLTDSYYDLLASEARQSSFVAIAKRDIPSKHWQNLSRTLTSLNKYKGLISWSGTAFEYLMPNINIRKYDGSLLDESCKFMIMSQKEYAKKLGIPWGISEAAFNLKDFNSNYQYKAFGIPWLGLKRGLADDLVVSSYGSILAITDFPKDVINNIKKLEKQGMYGKFGLYESIDYTPARLNSNQKYSIVKTYMAHHQGLILLSINNLLNNNIISRRFMSNPEMEAIDILLQERMPENVILTKENKEKVEKIKYKDYENYSERVYQKINNKLNNCNVISNEEYTVCINERGEGFSKYKNIYINRFKETTEIPQGIFFYIKNIKSKKIWTTSYMSNLSKPDKYSVHFMPDKDKFVRVDGNIETTLKIVTAQNSPVEIRNIELKNRGNIEEILEITSYLEPVISKREQDYAHMAFNNLFLKYDFLSDTNTILVKRNKRGAQEPVYLGVNLYTDDDTIGELEYEIDKEKLYGRTNLNVPEMIKESKPLSKTIGLVVDPVIALKRTIKIMPGEKINLNLIICVSNSEEKIKEYMEKYTNTENINRTFEFAKAKVEEEARYLNIKGKDIDVYQKMLSYLLFQNPTKKLYINKLPKRTYSQNELWKFGVSGDNPILLVKIQDVNDIYIIRNLLKAYEFFRSKNINVDLVILNGEDIKGEQYVKQAIENEILNKQLAYLKNISGGIFILNLENKEDKELLEFRANLIIDAKKGNLKSALQDMEEDYLNTINHIKEENKSIIIKEQPETSENKLEKNKEKLKYYNNYGGFSEDGKEYLIRVNKSNKLPAVWSHMLANKKFGTLVTENQGGYTWYKNSRLNKISSWSNNSVMDIPSEIIYLKDKETGIKWSLGSMPMPDDNDYYITYGLGYAKYSHTSCGIIQELEVFVPTEDSIKVNILKLKNTMPTKKTLKLIYYVKPVLCEDEILSNGYINIEKNANNNLVYAKNLYNADFKNSIIYVSSSEKIQSYTGDKRSFIGNGNISNPDALDKISLNNENSLGKDSCIAIQLDIELKQFESKEISLIIGGEEKLVNVYDTAYRYSNIQKCRQELKNAKDTWYNIVDKIQVYTPVESINIILNSWILYQVLSSRLISRTAFYQSGGARGFRDQLQDTLCLKYIKPEALKDQVIEHAKHQFIEGDVLHWWHKETNKGIRTRFSDDLLWLPYVVCEYIETTGDMSILDINVKYLQGDLLPLGIDERYDIYEESQTEESIYMHCIRAIDKSLKFGENGLPKIGSGDWNDGFSTVGNKGKGESVWLAFFIYEVLNRMIPICKQRSDMERSDKYQKIQEELKKSVNLNAWDGRWYKRAFCDNGDVLGSIENEECRIDSIAQSWSVISNAGDNDKKYISMNSLENHLVDRENGIIKLLDPPFNKSKLEPGYIKSYLPGVRENGGQYTHAAIWAIIAEAILGFGDKAEEFFRMINPIEHTRTKEAVKKYKVEPYVIPADVYGAGNLVGRGGWTWYTGSASWYYKAGIEYILGLNIKKGVLKMKPNIPNTWKEYQIRYKYKNSVYNIKIKNPNGKNNGVEEVKLNGEIMEEKSVKLVDNGKVNEVEVIM